MGKRGPAPQSAKHQARRGFPGRRKGKTTAAIAASDTAAADIKTAKDSLSVQPLSAAPSDSITADTPAAPSWLTDHAAIAIWRELWSAPDAVARIRLKDTDVAFLARYCWKRAQVEAWMARPKIRRTFTTRTTTGAKAVKVDPTYTQMMELQREVTSDEGLIGLTPKSRADLANRFAESRDPHSPPLKGGNHPAAAHAARADANQKPASPLGLLAGRGPAPDTPKH